jgi:predicted permease
METLWQDIRYGLRMLAKSPGFTAIAVLTLALGIGANTGIFSVLRQVLLQRLPVPHPEQLVLLYSPGPKQGHTSSNETGSEGAEAFSYPMYKDLRDNSAAVFEGLAAKGDYPVSIAFHSQTERAEAEIVSGNYFETLKVQPALGRPLMPSDTAAEGGNPVVVLGYGYWKKRFGSDPTILNQTLLINDHAMTVVGVLRAGFDGVELGRVPDVYIPVTMKASITPNWNGLENHKDYWITLIARLQPRVSREQAQVALVPTYRSLLEAELPLNTGLTDQTKKAFLERKLVLRDGARGRPNLEKNTRDQLLTLMGMVGLVLFITCANVAGLLTARGASRQKEIGVRLSLGGSRWTIVRQLLVESCLLSFAGALLGLLLAAWMTTALVHFASRSSIANGLSDALSLPALLFTAGLSVFCGLLFGIAPALNATRVQLASTLKEQTGALSSSLSHTRLRKVLVVAQVSLTLLLITGAWGFVTSLYNLKHVDLGLRHDHVLQFAVAPHLNGYDPARSLVFFRMLEDRLAALPGVMSLGGAEVSLLGNNDRGSGVIIEGRPTDPTQDHVLWNAVGPAHFSNLGIPLLSGREFTRADVADAPLVIIINETMAKTFFPDGHPLGRHMKFGGPGPMMQVVGVVRDSHHSDVREEPRPFAYIPYMQDSGNSHFGELTYYVRTSMDPAQLASSIHAAVSELDPNLPIFDVRTFDEQIDQQLASDKLIAALAATFGVLAGLLAAMGIYGLLAFTVTQRTREIGVRMALGAEPHRVGTMLFAEVARLTGIGLLLGIPLAYGLSKLISSLLFDVHSFGFASIGAALVALATVAAIAAYAPSRRAMRIDPMEALRYE